MQRCVCICVRVCSCACMHVYPHLVVHCACELYIFSKVGLCLFVLKLQLHLPVSLYFLDESFYERRYRELEIEASLAKRFTAPPVDMGQMISSVIKE